jgi:Flp pilus assembly protein TadG
MPTKNDSGAVLVEFAIVVPVLILLLLGGVDIGFASLSANKLNFATEAAANLPFAKLDRMAVRKRLDEIGQGPFPALVSA